MHAGFFAPCGICDVTKPRLRPYPRSSLRSRTTEKLRNVTKPRCRSSGGCSLPKNLVEFRRRSGERKSNHFLRRHVRRRKYFSARKRAHWAPLVYNACAAASCNLFHRGPSEAVLCGACACGTRKNPAAEAAGGCSLSKNLVEFRRRSGERKSNHFLRRHARRRKYRSARKRAPRVRCSEPQSAPRLRSSRRCQTSQSPVTSQNPAAEAAGFC